MRRHNPANNRRINELERDPLWEVTHADHTDEYPQPDPVGGHVPDYVARGPFGQTKIGETEHCGDNSRHTQSQHNAFRNQAQSNPGTSFEVNEFGCENDPLPDIDAGFSEFDPGFGGDKKDNSVGSLLDFF